MIIQRILIDKLAISNPNSNPSIFLVFEVSFSLTISLLPFLLYVFIVLIPAIIQITIAGKLVTKLKKAQINIKVIVSFGLFLKFLAATKANIIVITLTIIRIHNQNKV